MIEKKTIRFFVVVVVVFFDFYSVRESDFIWKSVVT